MKTIRVVAGLAEIDGKYFVGRRSIDRSLGGMWEFPGGKVENNESDEKALARELMEEFGVETQVSDKYSDVMHHQGELTINLVVYRIKFLDSPTISNSHDSITWATKEELQALNFCPADLPIVQALSK